MRLNEQGGILTYHVYSKTTGEQLLVDDRTFDEELHSHEPIDAAPKPKAKKGAKAD